MASAERTAGNRYLFIDLFRSAVIVLMLEGHVLRTLLAVTVQSAPVFRLHEFLHGLSAPAFLFGAGLTFVISTKRRWTEFHRWGPLLSRRVRRLLFVIALGFFLHLPFFSLRKIVIDGMESDVLQFFQFDVLHCIGFGLLALHALIFLFRTEVRFYGLVLATVAGVCFLTPLVWDLDPLRRFGPWAAQALNGRHGSPFPLFPYLGFLFAGVIVSWEYLVARDEGKEGDFMVRLFALGSAAIGIGTFFDLLPGQVYPTYNFWFTSPNYFIIRIGALMIGLSVAWYTTRRLTAIPPLAVVLGVESLFVYVSHLVLLYGSVLNPEWNLQTMIGSNLPLGQSLLWVIGFLAGMLALASLWRRLKERATTTYRIVQIAASALFLLAFIARDY